MTHYRSALRAVTKDLIEASPAFAAYTKVLAAARVDSATVPCWSVSTPSEDETVDSDTLRTARTDLVVALSVSGNADDIEDILDTLGGVIRATILDGLSEQTGAQNVQLKRTEIKPGQDGKAVIGTVMTLFEVVGYIQKT